MAFQEKKCLHSSVMYQWPIWTRSYPFVFTTAFTYEILLFSVSGYNSFDTAREQGAFMTDAHSRCSAGIFKNKIQTKLLAEKRWLNYLLNNLENWSNLSHVTLCKTLSWRINDWKYIFKNWYDWLYDWKYRTQIIKSFRILSYLYEIIYKQYPK